jgi:hypothetical protein
VRFDELTDTGTIERWWPTLYEPETAAFGGPTGMDAVHDLFCADSAGVLQYLRQDSPGLGRRELSILLLSGLMRAAGLDTFECGDMFDRVARLRSAPPMPIRRESASWPTTCGCSCRSPTLPTASCSRRAGRSRTQRRGSRRCVLLANGSVTRPRAGAWTAASGPSSPTW